MVWEVYALRYGRHEERSGAESLLGRPDLHDTPMPMDYFVWLLRSGTQEIVVDTGFAPTAPLNRGRRVLNPVDTMLRRIGCEAAAVRDVIITHLHYDHAGNLPMFPAARFHIQDSEMSFATGRHMCATCLRVAYDVEDVVQMVRAVYADRVTFHDGTGEIAPGVTVHRAGGHTEGLMMVRVETARGPVVLASDASHYYANMEQGIPFPIVFNMGDMAQGWAAARALAGDPARVVPGHDPLVRSRYPAVPGTDGEIVMLHVDPVA